MKTLRGRRVAQNFLRDDNEPGHGGNRLAVVYAKRQPAQSVRAFVRAPAGPSCTRWTLVHPLDPRAPAGSPTACVDPPVHCLPDTCFRRLATRP